MKFSSPARYICLSIFNITEVSPIGSFFFFATDQTAPPLVVLRVLLPFPQQPRPLSPPTPTLVDIFLSPDTGVFHTTFRDCRFSLTVRKDRSLPFCKAERTLPFRQLRYQGSNTPWFAAFFFVYSV